MAYFQLTDSQFSFKLYLKYIPYLGLDQRMPILLRGLLNNPPYYYLIDSGPLAIVMFCLLYEP